MRKMLFTIIALMLTASLFLCGCEDVPAANEPPKVVFVDGNPGGKEQKILFGKAIKHTDLPIICIDSKEAMDDFNQRARENVYMVEGTTGELVELPTIVGYNDAVAPYTEDFFKEKSLIVTFAYTTSSPAVFEVNDISIENNKLSILVEAFAIGVDAAIDGRFIFIEMPKSDLEGVTEFVAVWDIGEVV